MTDPKRPPPTIDLEPNPPGEDGAWRGRLRAWRSKFGWPSFSFGPRWPDGLRSSRVPLLAAVSGALAALALVAILWSAGLMTQRTTVLASPPAATDELAVRLTRIEARLSAPPAVDPALATRVAGLEQSIEAMRQSSQQMQQALQRQSEAVASALNEIKSAPRETAPAPAPAVDLGPLNRRIAELEQSIRGLAAARRAEPQPIDPALSHMIVANQLAAAVRNGEPYAEVLAAASQSGNAAALAPLEVFAATGVPGDAALARELIALLPQLAPKLAPQPQPSGWLERLEASAAALVRVRPAGEADPSSLVARIAAAARGNDVAIARREFDRLPQAQRAPAQAWIARYDAREAARKAALDFAAKAPVAQPRP